MNALAHLPLDIARRRVLPTKASAAFLGISVSTLRRLKDQRALPQPIELSARRIGWRIGDLCDYQDARIAGLTWHEWKAAQAVNDNSRM
jgi:predicted DNA-binding transcriptional regulator AlpA